MQSFLRFLNLTDQEISVYKELFNFKDIIIKELENQFNISKSKLYQIISKLEDKGLINSILDGKTKKYNVADPEKLITYRKQMINELQEQSQTTIYELKERYDHLHSKHTCLVKPTHFLMTNKKLALLKLKEYIFKAETEILLVGVPLWVINEVKDLLKQVQEKGLNIRIFIPDFEVIPKQYKGIKEFFPKIIVIPHYQLISVNGENYFNGQFLVDRKYMVNLIYNDVHDLILQSFAGFNCINRCILPDLTGYLTEEEPIKFSSKEKTILNMLKEQSLSKKELSTRTGLSGKSLNVILEKLSSENKIVISLKKHGKGRPRKEVSLRV